MHVFFNLKQYKYIHSRIRSPTDAIITKTIKTYFFSFFVQIFLSKMQSAYLPMNHDDQLIHQIC